MAVNEMEAPELPSGEIAVEKPPSQVEAGGMGSILATAIPLMGLNGCHGHHGADSGAEHANASDGGRHGLHDALHGWFQHLPPGLAVP